MAVCDQHHLVTESLVRIEAALDSHTGLLDGIRQDMAKVRSSLYGNGVPGLHEQMRVMEAWRDGLREREKAMLRAAGGIAARALPWLGTLLALGWAAYCQGVRL